MLRMIGWSLVLWLCLVVTTSHGFQCTNNKVGSCNCQRSLSAKYEIFCPSLIDYLFHINYEPGEALELVCYS